MEESRYWETDEFEDLVTRSILGQHERVLSPKETTEPGKYLPKKRVVNQAQFEAMKRYGLLILPHDRIVYPNEYWYDIDGLQDEATWAYRFERGPGLISGYIEMAYLRKIKQFPRGVIVPARCLVKYRLMRFWPQESGGVEGYSFYVGLTKDGKLVSEYEYGANKKTLKENKANELGAAGLLQGVADMKVLWNVTALEGEAKTIFGVYPEQIKSLLYARDLPLTATGRKRPILHWVASHKRRMKSGTEIDIKKHLRGINEFEMHGTQFKITRPVKGT